MSVPTIPQLQQKLQYANSRVRFAWAKYYEAVQRDHRAAHAYHGTLVASASEPSVPTHIKTALTEMATALKKKYECPICMEMIEPEHLSITNCGHFYCDGCLSAMKAHARAADPRASAKWECAVCRRKHKIGEEDD